MEYFIGGLVVWVFAGWLVSYRYDNGLLGVMVGLFLGPFTAIVALNAYQSASKEILDKLSKER
ncbi:MAG: hypothetical protein GY928_36585 [Colwellia sp.]|nr:hypothetical protein [Colwellia sp.]